MVRSWKVIVAVGALLVLGWTAWGALTPGQELAAKTLIKQLTDPEFNMREAAVQKLVALGPDVLPLVKPLLNGEIRSAFGMTEPGLASSDAKNIACRAELVGDEWVINGEKYYISGAGDPRCKIMILMVQTSP